VNIEITGVSKSFGKKEVLKNLSFSARGGQFVGILGENGSGKSTLFSIVTGLQKGEGAFMYNGTDLLHNPSLEQKRWALFLKAHPFSGNLLPAII